MRTRARLLTFAATAALTAWAAVAAAQPAVVPVQGFLTTGVGDEVSGALPATIQLYSAPTGGTLLHTETYACAAPPTNCLTVVDGRFVANLGSTSPLNLNIFDGTTLYLAVSVNGSLLDPRIPIATTPYAARAQRAAVANAVPWSGITGMPAGFADGTDDVGSYAGTAPIAINAGTREIGLSSLDCDPGETWVWNGTSWDCTAVAASGGTTYTQGNGIAINTVGANTVISIDAQDCDPGFYSRWDGTSWGCFADQTGIASIAAGAGISVLGNEVSIGALACAEGNASRWNGAAWECDQVTATFAGAGLRQVGDELEIDSAACSAGQVSRWTEVTPGNFAWTCVTDQVGLTSLSAGGGITVNANQISINSANCEPDEYSSFRGGAWVCVPDTTELPAAGAGLQLVDVLGVSTLRINAPACGPEQFITWDGSDWACANDTTGLTGIGQGDGILVAGNVVSIASASCGPHQYSSFRSGAWGCYDVVTALDPQAGLVLSGRQLSLDADVCTGNQRTVWNGTRFVCADDLVGFTTLSRGTGISGTGNQVNINIAAACTPAEPYLTWTASGWDCVADVSSTLSARRGLEIVDGAVQIDAPNCGPGQYARWNEDAGSNTYQWSCHNDLVGFQSLALGTGLTGAANSNQVNIAAPTCTPAEPYLTWTASGWDCVADVSSSLTAAVPNSGLQIVGSAISTHFAGGVCGANQFARWTSTGWVCDNDQVGFTDLARGTGIGGAVGSNQVSINATACTVSEPYLTWTAEGWDCVADQSSSLTASVTSGLQITGTAISIRAARACTPTEYSWWDGDSWECTTDRTGLLAVQAGRGVTVTGASNDTVNVPVPDCGAGQVLTFNRTSASSGWECVADTSGTTVTAGRGMRFTGTVYEPSMTVTCNNTTQKLRYAHDTGLWTCVDDFGVTGLAAQNGTNGLSPVRGTVTGTGSRTLTLDLATSAGSGATLTECVAGEVWRYNGTRWLCEPAVTQGVGISVSTSGQVSISGSGCTTNGQVLTYNGSDWACTTPVVGIQRVDGTATISVADGTGTPDISLNSGGCSDGEVWRWINVSTGWRCDPAVSPGNGIAVSPLGVVSLSYTGDCTAANRFLQYNNGTWTCGAVSNVITSVTGTSPITATTSSGATTVTMTGCGSGNDNRFWEWNGSTWACARPITTVESGSHGGLTFAADGTLRMRNCAANEVLKWSTTTGWTCGADAQGVTSVASTGTELVSGILVTGGATASPTVGLTTSGCVAGEVLRRNTSNNGWECVPAVTQSTAAGFANTVSVGADGTVSLGTGTGGAGTATLCDTGDVWRRTASGWECVPQLGGVSSVAPASTNQIAVTNGTTNATLALGVGTGTGATLCEAGEVWRRNSTNGAWECVPAVTAGTGISVTTSGASTGTISLGVCPTVGHVWKNVGGVMQCAADTDTGITSVNVASPLTGNGVGTAISFLDSCAANGVWRRNSTDAGWECVVLPRTITGAGAVDATGNIRLTSANCTDGTVMKWSGGVWTCGTDNTGAGYTSVLTGGGLRQVSATQVSMALCPVGQVLTSTHASNGTYTCRPTLTATTAGRGLTVTAATASANATIALPGFNADCDGANNALRWDLTTGNWSCGTVAPTPATCTGSNQALRWDGGAWTCGTVASLAAPTGTCTGNNALRWNGSAFTCETVAPYPGASACGSAGTHASRWTGSGWACEPLPSGMGAPSNCTSGTNATFSLPCSVRTVRFNLTAGSWPAEVGAWIQQRVSTGPDVWVDVFTLANPAGAPGTSVSGPAIAPTPPLVNLDVGGFVVGGVYRIRMEDSYGDGWNGATLSATYQDACGTGGSVFSGVTLASGNSSGVSPTATIVAGTAASVTLASGAGAGNCDSGAHTQRIVHGSVGPAGTIEGGTGFRVYRISQGRYRVQFSTAFTSAQRPSVSVTLAHSYSDFGGFAYTDEAAVLTGVSNSQFEVVIGDAPGVFYDRGFSFMVVGKN